MTELWRALQQVVVAVDKAKIEVEVARDYMNKAKEEATQLVTSTRTVESKLQAATKMAEGGSRGEFLQTYSICYSRWISTKGFIVFH